MPPRRPDALSGVSERLRCPQMPYLRVSVRLRCPQMPYLGCLDGTDHRGTPRYTTVHPVHHYTTVYHCTPLYPLYTTVHPCTPLYTTVTPCSCAAGSVVLWWDSVYTTTHRPPAQLVVGYCGGTASAVGCTGRTDVSGTTTMLQLQAKAHSARRRTGRKGRCSMVKLVYIHVSVWPIGQTDYRNSSTLRYRKRRTNGTIQWSASRR